MISAFGFSRPHLQRSTYIHTYILTYACESIADVRPTNQLLSRPKQLMGAHARVDKLAACWCSRHQRPRSWFSSVVDSAKNTITAAGQASHDHHCGRKRLDSYGAQHGEDSLASELHYAVTAGLISAARASG